jgi:oleate hydratase
VTEETNRAAKAWRGTTRSGWLDGSVADAHAMGFTERDRIDLVALIVKARKACSTTSASPTVRPAFLRDQFWMEWCTLFAFEPWHTRDRVSPLSAPLRPPFLDDRRPARHLSHRLQPV